MTDDTNTTVESIIDARSRGRPSRRSVLGSVAAMGALAGVPTGVFGRQEDADGPGTTAEGEGEGGDDLEIVANFEPPSLPENIAIDSAGTVYLSTGPAGEIRAVDPDGGQSSVATIETGEEGLLLGIALLNGSLYAANAAGDEAFHGAWRVDLDGDAEPERIAALPFDETVPNDIIPDPGASDALLVSDHLGGAIWRVTTDGQAEPWVSDPSLEPDADAANPVGADGLAVHPDGDVYVDNLDAGSIIRVPVEDGNAGRPEEVVRDEGLVGADGLAIDEDGAVYVAVNARNEIVRVTPDHDLETVVAGEGLDFPADVHFGTTEETTTTLYIANFAYGTFLEDEDAAAPSLASIDVGARGYFPNANGAGDANETEPAAE